MSRSTSSGCLSRQGKPLCAFEDSFSAERAAERVSARYDRPTVSYRCERCQRWHLSPAKRQTPSQRCDACDKRAYVSEEVAERRAEIILAERGRPLRVYACPYGEGWHLTSQLR